MVGFDGEAVVGTKHMCSSGTVTHLILLMPGSNRNKSEDDLALKIWLSLGQENRMLVGFGKSGIDLRDVSKRGGESDGLFERQS